MLYDTRAKLFPADIVVLAIGVRPEIALAKSAGLEIGERGGIRVDEKMRTSDKHIWAIGDAVEVVIYIGEWMVLALAARPAVRAESPPIQSWAGILRSGRAGHIRYAVFSE